MENNFYQIKGLRQEVCFEDAIKDQELTARLRAIEEGYKTILSELADENKSAK